MAKPSRRKPGVQFIKPLSEAEREPLNVTISEVESPAVPDVEANFEHALRAYRDLVHETVRILTFHLIGDNEITLESARSHRKWLVSRLNALPTTRHHTMIAGPVKPDA